MQELSRTTGLLTLSFYPAFGDEFVDKGMTRLAIGTHQGLSTSQSCLDLLRCPYARALALRCVKSGAQDKAVHRAMFALGGFGDQFVLFGRGADTERFAKCRRGTHVIIMYTL